MGTEFRGRDNSGEFNAQAACHLFVEEAFVRIVGLDPFTVDDELWDSPLASPSNDFIGGARGRLDIDFFVGDVVLREKALRLAAISAPERGVNEQFHGQCDLNTQAMDFEGEVPLDAIQFPVGALVNHIPGVQGSRRLKE
jgi:hypothetical protein